MGLEIGQLAPADAPELAEIYFACFEDDPTIRALWKVPVNDSMKQFIIEQRTKSFENLKNNSNSFELCVRDTETGEIASEAAYKIVPKQENNNYETFIDLPQHPEWDGLRMNKVIRLEWEMRVAIMGPQSFVHFTRVRTSPKHQRRGAASLLLQRVVDHAARLNLPIYLASSAQGLRFYQKFNFQQIDTFDHNMPDIPLATQFATCMILPPPSNPDFVQNLKQSYSKPAHFESSPPVNVEIRSIPLTEEGLLNVVRIMDASFKAGPFIQLVFGASNRSTTQEERARRELSLTMASPGIFSYDMAVDTASGAVVGVSKWCHYADPHQIYWPNGRPHDRPEIRIEPWEAMFGEIKRRRERIFREKDCAYTYMSLLAVMPAYQRMGIGGKLLKAGLERVDERGEECFIDASAEGLALYKKWGWEEVTKVSVDLAEWGGEGIDTTVGLIRKPGKGPV